MNPRTSHEPQNQRTQEPETQHPTTLAPKNLLFPGPIPPSERFSGSRRGEVQPAIAGGAFHHVDAAQLEKVDLVRHWSLLRSCRDRGRDVELRRHVERCAPAPDRDPLRTSLRVV